MASAKTRNGNDFERLTLSVERNTPTLPIRVFADAFIIWLKNRGLKSPRLFMFTSTRRLLSNELRVISNEPFMIFCSFVSKKHIAHPSLLTAHRSLYVMLNLVKHLTTSLYLSFSADVFKKKTRTQMPSVFYSVK